jgi:hypothetical protein
MNGTSGGPHILLLERDQQLTALLSSELALAGYEVHTARTAVEVFDAIARFPVRLVMVNLAQAQASRREFWSALDAQRRGRGVQVFAFRCANLGGYGPEDPDERVDMVPTDLEVDGMRGLVQLVDGVRARVPGSTATSSAPVRPAAPASIQDDSYAQSRSRAVEVPLPPQASPVYQREIREQPAPVYQPAPIAAQAQPLHATLRPQPQEVPPARPAEAPRPGRSTFTDKIRAVIYPGSRHAVPEPGVSPTYYQATPAQPGVQYQNPDVQPRPQASQRFAEAEYPSANIYREDMMYQSPAHPGAPSQAYPTYNSPASASEAYLTSEESGLDQLSRMVRDSQPAPQHATVNGNMQNSVPRPGLSIDAQEIQEFREQILRAARIDEEYERASMPQPRPVDPASMGSQLRASPIQNVPFEQEIAYRRGAINGAIAPSSDNGSRPAMAILQPTQTIPPVQQMPQQQPQMMSPAQQVSQPQPQMMPSAQQISQPLPPVQQMSQPLPPVQPAPGQMSFMDARAYSAASSQVRPAFPPETPISAAASSQIRPLQGSSPQTPLPNRQNSGQLSVDEDDTTLADQVQANTQSGLSRRPEVRTSDDMLLDIVKSLPPMAPAPQPPAPQPQVLNGRATRSLGSVLLEGHLVPQERLQVAQHVQRMMRGVDLNYQLGEILLMFKLLTPDQLLAASLVSYGMISTIQITGLGRIRQELHAMGLEYDLESLLILFRILTPEQLREVRASWSS